MSTQVNHPFTNVINNGARALMKNAKTINDSDDINELQRKLDVAEAITTKLNSQLTIANASTRKDANIINRLNHSIRENDLLKDSLRNTINRLGGTIQERAQLNAAIEEKAQLVARLENLVEEKEHESKQELEALQLQITNLTETRMNLQNQIEQKERDLVSLRELSNRLNQENPRLVARIAESEAQLAALRSEFDVERQQLTLNIRMAESRVERLQELLRQKEREESTCRSDLTRIRQQFDSVNGQLAAATTSLEEVRARADQDINTREVNITRLQTEIADLTRQLRQIEEEHALLGSRNQQHELQIQQLNEMIQSSKAKDIQDSQTQQRLTIEIDRLQAEVRRLEQSNAGSAGQVEQLQQQMVQLNGELDRVNQEKGALNLRMAELTGDKNALSSEVLTLQQLIEATRAELEAEHQTKQQQLSLLQKGSICEEENKKLEAELGTLRSEKLGLDAEVARLKASQAEDSSKITALENEKNRLVEAEKAKEKILKATKQKLDISDDRIKEQDGRIQRIINENASKTQDLTSQIQTRDQQIKELEKKAGQLTVTLQEKETLQAELKALKKQLDEKQNESASDLKEQFLELEKARAEVATKDKEILGFTQQIAELQAVIDSTQKDEAQVAADLREKSEQLKQKTSELNESVSQLEVEKDKSKSLAEQLERVNEEKAKLAVEIQRVIGEEKRKQDELDFKQNETARLQKEIAEKEQEILKERQKTDKLTSEKEALEREIKRNNDSAEVHTEKIRELEQKISESKQEVEDLKIRTVSASKSAEQKVEQLTSQIRALENASEQDISDKTSQIAQLTAEVETLRNQMTQNTGTVEEYERNKARFDAEIKKLQEKLSQGTEQMQMEREEFEQAKRESIKRMQLKDAEVDQLKAMIKEMKQKETANERRLQQEAQERDQTIRKLQEDIQKMSTNTEQVIQGLEKGLQDCQSVKAQLESDMKEEKKRLEEKLSKAVNQAQYDSVLNDLNTLKLRQQEELSRINERNNELEEAKNKFEQIARQKEDTITKLEVRLQEVTQQLQEEEEKNQGRAAALILKGGAQLELLKLEEEKVSELQSLMTESMGVYNRLMVTMFKPYEKPAGVERLSMKDYVTSCLYMFYLWKAVVRIPVVLRSEEFVDRYLKYNLPDPVILKLIKDKLGSDAVRQNFDQKVDVDGKRMRIDVLLYFLVIALMSIADQDVSEFNTFLLYISNLIQYTSQNAKDLLKEVEGFNSTQADAIRMEHDKNSQIVTFVRFTSITPNDTNKRFNYKTLNKKTLQMNYDETPVPFYQQVDGDWEEKDDLKIDHKYQYWYGPFTGVFDADLDNADIIASPVFQQSIEDRLRKLEPVCIVGYGASGSGKTTSLIYADYKTKIGGVLQRVQRPGLLILLANKLASQKQVDQQSTQFDQCNVSLFEFETHPSSILDANDDTKYICRKFPAKDNTSVVRRIVRVKTNPDEFEENDVPFELCEQSSNEQFKYSFVGGEWMNEAKEGIEKQLVDYINIKRNVAPSPNNPQSSRSHVVCVLTFTNTKTRQQTTLIVCDFAGVENRFDCTDMKTLMNVGIPKLVEAEKESVLLKMSSTLEQQEREQVMQSSYYPQGRNLFLPTMYDACNELYGYVRAKLFELNVAGSAGLRNFYKSCLGKPNALNDDILKKIDKVEASAEAGPSKKPAVSASAASSSSQEIEPTFLSEKLTPALISSVKDIRFDIGLIQNYQNVLINVDNNKLFQVKDSKPAQLLPLVADLPREIRVRYKKAFDFLISEYSLQEGDEAIGRVNLDNLSIPSLIKTLVWYVYQYKHYNAMYHSIITNQLYPVKTDLAAVDVLDNAYRTEICKTRVREGRFINKSLAQLRQFIGYTLKKMTATGYAPFIDKCAPIQCNPYFRDCFGKNDYFDRDVVKSKDVRYQFEQFGPLSKTIASVPNADKLTFCIFTVVNLSKNANNPPPSPYIDISNLLIERERLKNMFSNANAKASLVEPTFGLSGKPVVDLGIIQELESRPLLKYAPKAFRETVQKMMTSIKSGKGNVIDTLDGLVEEFTNFNAITTIGTLEFTDMMAKYASNRVVCATKLPQNFSYEGPVEQVVLPVEQARQGPQTRASQASVSQASRSISPRRGPSQLRYPAVSP
jgi:chromosome segregation ATPase